MKLVFSAEYQPSMCVSFFENARILYIFMYLLICFSLCPVILCGTCDTSKCFDLWFAGLTVASNH